MTHRPMKHRPAGSQNAGGIQSLKKCRAFRTGAAAICPIFTRQSRRYSILLVHTGTGSADSKLGRWWSGLDSEPVRVYRNRENISPKPNARVSAERDANDVTDGSLPAHAHRRGFCQGVVRGANPGRAVFVAIDDNGCGGIPFRAFTPAGGTTHLRHADRIPQNRAWWHL